MKWKINSQTAATINVTFEHEGVTHTRDVNACLTAKGKYDAAATEARINDVAAGVEVKIAAGAITNPPPPPPAPEAAAPAK